jgi:hypothetical protein
LNKIPIFTFGLINRRCTCILYYRKRNYVYQYCFSFKNLYRTPGASGFEEIRQLVLEEIKDLADEVETDNLGNVYAIKRGKERKKVMIGAHMDEIGFIVTHIDDKGFIVFIHSVDLIENTDCTTGHHSRKKRHHRRKWLFETDSCYDS